MTITEKLTDAQKEKILHHFRAAALSRARQWDHERVIEQIVNGEISDFGMENFASGVDDAGPGVSPDDLTFIAWEDIEDIINNTITEY